ncbi:hypothetical protein N7540_003331 [Penicillium herquei]|nr:hypothetical protein N7540_003331 [Penicillium herquei]
MFPKKILTSNNPEYWATNCVVESFQIAVPGGDCSIHLLVEQDIKTQVSFWKGQLQSNSTDESLKTVVAPGKQEGLVSAVLVDGGYDGNGRNTGDDAANAIKKALKDLTSTYGEIRFTSWVVSHWDRDHYSGSIRMILDDLYNQYQKKSRLATAWRTLTPKIVYSHPT